MNFIKTNQQGSTMVEAVIAFPLLLILLLVTFDLLRICWHQLSLQYALTRTARAFCLNRTMSAADFRVRINTELGGLGVSVAAGDQVTICPVDVFNSTSCPLGGHAAAAASQLVAFQVVKPLRTLIMRSPFALDAHDLRVSALVLMRTEPE